MRSAALFAVVVAACGLAAASVVAPTSAAPPLRPHVGLSASQALPSPTGLAVTARRYRADRPRRYQVNSVLSFPVGTVPWGGVTTLQAKDGRAVVGRLSTTMDRLGHADFKLRLAKGLNPRRVRVQVFFEGNDTLAPFSSEKVRLR